jgi:1,4-alpha-glucan branching enzyme
MADTAHQGLCAVPHRDGVAFRVWAPHADAVHVTGTFNDWSLDATPMAREDGGTWYAEAENGAPGDEYRILVRHGGQLLSRIDPYARAVTKSVGNGIVTERLPAPAAFDAPDWNRLVIYEMHIGTFARSDEGEPGTFEDAVGRLRHLRRLGVNAVQIMPAAEFAGDLSWGYNPAHIFAVESSYGGPEGLRRFVEAAHAAGMAVILDVVYNHFGPSDLDLWQFDGWSENDKGGIYFYNG